MILRYQKNAFLIFCLTILFLFVFASTVQATSKDTTNNLVTCEGYQVWSAKDNEALSPLSPLFRDALSIQEWNTNSITNGKVQVYGLIDGEILAITGVMASQAELTHWIKNLIESEEKETKKLKNRYIFLGITVLLLLGIFALVIKYY